MRREIAAWAVAATAADFIVYLYLRGTGMTIGEALVGVGVFALAGLLEVVIKHLLDEVR